VRRAAIVVAITSGAALGALTLVHARTAAAAIPPLITALVGLAAVSLAPPTPRAVGPGR
jgi:predicted MFS family arabinose efflux permease